MADFETLYWFFNLFPNKQWFLRICSTSLLKTLLVISNFSFSHTVFHIYISLVRQDVALCGNGLSFIWSVAEAVVEIHSHIDRAVLLGYLTLVLLYSTITLLYEGFSARPPRKCVQSDLRKIILCHLTN